jgi:hypothetical protein
VFVREAAGGPVTAILEWFHIAMRVHHLQQLARGLSTRVPTHAAAAAKIQAELERLHWRLWHGRTDGPTLTFRAKSDGLGGEENQALTAVTCTFL